MKVLKGILIVLLSVAILFDATYLVIYFFAPSKITVTTVEGDVLKNVEKNDLKYIFNIRYFKNKDNSGKECFELQLNYFIDEDISDEENNDEKVYSKGIQLINPTMRLWGNGAGSRMFLDKTTYKTILYPYFVYNMYQNNSYLEDFYSPNEVDYEKAALKVDELFKKEFFRITLGDDIYKLTFKNEDRLLSESGDPIFGWVRTEKWRHVNFAYFLNKLYNSVATLPAGENQVKLFEFFDYLNYQKYNKTTGQYTNVINDKDDGYELIKEQLVSYYAIKIDVYDEGIKSSRESLFNCVSGNFGYRLTEEDEVINDYFVGFTKIQLTEACFDFVQEEDTLAFYPILKNEVREKYKDYKDLYVELLFDMNYLKTLGIDGVEIKLDKLNLGNLKFYKLNTIYLQPMPAVLYGGD